MIDQFVKCLSTISHSRAGWDFEMSWEQRDKENKQLASALAEARKIWRDNPDQHEALRDAFSKAQPLASMSEIEKLP